MLDTVLTRLQVKVTSVISNVMILTKHSLSKLIGVLIEIQTLFVDSLTSLLSLCAQTLQKFRALLAQLINQVLSIKAVLITAKQTLIQTGSQLLTIARQTLQRAATVIKKSKDLVEKIRLGLLLISESRIAQLPIVRQLIQGGLKFAGRVSQLLQRALCRLFKGR